MGGRIVVDRQISSITEIGARATGLKPSRTNSLPIAQNGIAFTDFQHVTPKQQIKANVGWAQDKWEADMAFITSPRPRGLSTTSTGTGLTPVPAYFNADARMGYRINDNLALSVSGQNLLQPRQVQTSGPAIERRILVNLAATY